MQTSIIEAGASSAQLDSLETRAPRAVAGVRPAAWIAVLLLALPLGLLYYDSFLVMVETWWSDPNNSHGLLIPPLAVYFAWQRRRGILSAPVRPRPAAGLSLVLFSLAVYFVGRLGAEFFLTRSSGILLLAGLALYFWGWPRLKLLTFPLFFLALAIPIPALLFNTVALPLQGFASASSAGLLQMCDLPVLREGNVIHLAGASLGVAEACSGLRSLMALVTLSILLAYLQQSGWVRRALSVVLAVPVALLLNILRIALTAVIADSWDVKYAMGFFHTFSGWLVFLVAFGILYGLNGLIARLPLGPAPVEEAA